mmetsp:Transcript_92592/g.288666  ORF Transcript_92592/g.288666 Transcript_92592/m.288666 type:complete len:221 (+) Transcript_92592:994-1656(+)
MELAGRGPVFCFRVPFEGESCAFQVLQDKDWKRRYWPPISTGLNKTANICGPGVPPAEGLNWNARRPEGCEGSLLLVRFEPLTARLNWAFSPAPSVGRVRAAKALVVLHGMPPESPLNGTVGITEDWDAAKEQWVVRLPDGGQLRAPLEHVRPLAEAVLAPGVVVRLRRLEDRPMLRGLAATCLSWIPEADTWRLRLWAGQRSHGELEVQAEYIELGGFN